MSKSTQRQEWKHEHHDFLISYLAEDDNDAKKSLKKKEEKIYGLYIWYIAIDKLLQEDASVVRVSDGWGGRGWITEEMGEEKLQQG